MRRCPYMPHTEMLSSVRRGLADVRDAIAPVITILDYGCVRFEDMTSQPVPPRAVCVRMVEDADIYLLLLGESYGDPMPGTGLAPTDEEWTVARNLGKPIVVFKKEGIPVRVPELRGARAGRGRASASGHVPSSAVGRLPASAGSTRRRSPP